MIWFSDSLFVGWLNKMRLLSEDLVHLCSWLSGWCRTSTHTPLHATCGIEPMQKEKSSFTLEVSGLLWSSMASFQVVWNTYFKSWSCGFLSLIMQVSAEMLDWCHVRVLFSSKDIRTVVPQTLLCVLLECEILVQSEVFCKLVREI